MRDRWIQEISRLKTPEARALVRGLRDWAEFYRGRFFSLGSQKRLNAGIAYFEEEALRDGIFDPATASFQVRIESDPEVHVAVRLDAGNLEPVCTCNTFAGGIGACDHVVALVAFLFRASQGLSFGLHPPPEVYVGKLLKEMLTSEGPTLLSGQVETARPYSPTEDAGLKLGRGHFPAGIAGADDTRFVALVFRPPFYAAYWMGDSSDPLPSHLGMEIGWDRPEPEQTFFLEDEFGGFLEFCDDVREGGASVRIYVTPFRWVTLSGVYRLLSAKRIYDLDREKGEVREIVGDEPSFDGQPVLELAQGLILLANGDLVNGREIQGDVVGEIFRQAVEFGRWIETRGSGRTRPEPLTVNTFNAVSVRYFLPSAKYIDPENHFAVDGKDFDLPTWAKPEIPEVVINVVRNSRADEDDISAHAAIEMRVGDYAIPIDEILEDGIFRSIKGEEIDSRLTSAKRRRRVLLGGLVELFWVETKGARKELVDQIAADDSFVQLALRNKARRYLNAFHKAWIGGKRIRQLIAHPERGWILIETPLRTLAGVFVGLLQLKRWPDGGDLEIDEKLGFSLDVNELRVFLNEVSTLAAAFDVRVLIDDLDVETIPVSVAVDAKLTDDIDWFELTASVRCGGFTIPQEEWGLLIRGELLIEHENRILVPQLDQADAIEALRALFGNPKRKHAVGGAGEGAEARIPRLEILDWLAMRKRGVDLRIPEELRTIFESLEQFDGIPRKAVPRTLTASLREYQKRGYEWMVFLYEHRFGACLADDMGLGKTVQAIALLAWRRGQKGKRVGPNLVVVPPSLLFNWQHEIGQFCKQLKVAEYHGADREIEAMIDADVILTSYELVRRDIEALSKVAFDIVIFDEAQTLKNLSGERTKAALQLRRRFSLCLTGTPMENHVGEYFSVMNLALPGLFGDYKTFRKQTREGNLRVLDRAKPFVLRRTKSAILKELPEKVENDLYLEMTAEQKEIYTRTVAEVREEVAEAYGEKTQAQAGIVALAALTRLRQVCVSPELLGKPIPGLAPKLEYLVGKIRELADEGHSALVFSQFVRSLDLVDHAAKAEGLNCLRLDGSVPAQQRKQRVEAFQKGKEPAVFLISLRAGGVGLNLTRAQYVFHLDPWWNPAVENQATDRAHRIGQKETVFVQRLLMAGSVEEKIMELKRRKRAIFDSILGDGAAAKGTVLTRSDFEALL